MWRSDARGGWYKQVADLFKKYFLTGPEFLDYIYKITAKGSYIKYNKFFVKKNIYNKFYSIIFIDVFISSDFLVQQRCIFSLEP